MTKKITISVDDEAAARLVEMAGSSRKQGEFVSKLIHSVYENRETGGTSLATEDLRLKMLGVVAELSEVRSRMAALEQMRMQ